MEPLLRRVLREQSGCLIPDEAAQGKVSEGLDVVKGHVPRQRPCQGSFSLKDAPLNNMSSRSFQEITRVLRNPDAADPATTAHPTDPIPSCPAPKPAGLMGRRICQLDCRLNVIQGLNSGLKTYYQFLAHCGQCRFNPWQLGWMAGVKQTTHFLDFSERDT